MPNHCADWPLALPRQPVNHANRPQTEAELNAIRRYVARDQPLGTDQWIAQMARRLGLGSTLRPRGRHGMSPADGPAQ
ncbi:MAG: hypothetical protein ACKV0T_17310 [Planctomycetales bacterium]